MSRYRAGAVDQLVRLPHVLVEGVGEPARLGAAESRHDHPAELPGVDLGLARLRVHRHNGAGDVARRVSTLVVGSRQHVDHGVGHLALAPILVDLAEEGRLRADR